MELVISRLLFRCFFFLCPISAPTMGQIELTLVRVLRAHTIPTPDTIAQHLQYDVLDADITHDLFVTTLPAGISKVLEV